jgi:hypothetical protein
MTLDNIYFYYSNRVFYKIQLVKITPKKISKTEKRDFESQAKYTFNVLGNSHENKKLLTTIVLGENSLTNTVFENLQNCKNYVLDLHQKEIDKIKNVSL